MMPRSEDVPRWTRPLHSERSSEPSPSRTSRGVVPRASKWGEALDDLVLGLSIGLAAVILFEMGAFFW